VAGDIPLGRWIRMVLNDACALRPVPQLMSSEELRERYPPVGPVEDYRAPLPPEPKRPKPELPVYATRFHPDFKKGGRR
jgi:hypothetical protein